MQTITIDIINRKVLKLLQGLEQLHLIKVHQQNTSPTQASENLVAKYKGAMKQQSVAEIDNQLNELRSEWH